MLIANDHLDVIAADKMFLELYSRTEREVVGHPIAEVFGDADGVHDELLEALLFNEKRDNLMVRWHRADGTVAAARLTVAPVRLEHQEEDGLFVSVEDLG